MSAPVSPLRVSYSGRIQIITIDNPKKNNALNVQCYMGITNALKEASRRDDVILTLVRGTGSYFSSGTDLGDFKGGLEDPERAIKERMHILRDFINELIVYPKVLMAFVNGHAIGIAATILGLFDIVYCTKNATFWTPFSRLGITPEGCSTYTFPKIMGASLATEMLLFNRLVNATEAHACKLVSSIITETELHRRLEIFSDQPKNSLLLSKGLVKRWAVEDLKRANEAELEVLEKKFMSEEFFEAISRLMIKPRL